MPAVVTIILVVAAVLVVAWIAVVAQRRSADPATTATSQTPDRFHDVRRVDNTGN